MSDPWLIPPEPKAKRHRPSRRQQLLSSIFETFCAYLSIERQTTPRTITTYRAAFADFLRFAQFQTSAPVVVSHFTTELLKAYQYHLAERELSSLTARLRLSVLSSFGRWAARNERLERNPLDLIVRPPRRNMLPTVVRWDAVQELLAGCSRLRDKAILAVMAYGGLRRAEVVALDVRDFDQAFGLTRVRGKGGKEASVPLPKVARKMLAEYLATERVDAALDDPLFLAVYQNRIGKFVRTRISGHRVWKVTQSLGERAEIKGLHPHAIRHACAVELLRRTKNLRAVQEHLRHADIGSTTIYARLLPQELEEIVTVFDA